MLSCMRGLSVVPLATLTIGAGTDAAVAVHDLIG